MKLMTGFTVFTMLLASTSAQNPSDPKAAKAYHYYPASVTLQGVLRSVRHADPRENGKRPAIAVLQLMLDRKIEVTPEVRPASNTADLDSFKDIRSIQLFWSSDTEEAKARSFVGHPITATGTLNEATAPGEFTSVTMTVTAWQRN